MRIRILGLKFVVFIMEVGHIPDYLFTRQAAEASCRARQQWLATQVVPRSNRGHEHRHGHHHRVSL